MSHAFWLNATTCIREVFNTLGMDLLQRLSMKRAGLVADGALPRWRLSLALLVAAFVALPLLALRQEDAVRDGSLTVSRAQLSRRGATEWVDLPHSFLSASSDGAEAPVVYGFSVDLPAAPQVPMGLFVKRLARAGVLHVNGHAVAACAEAPVARIRCQDRPTLFRISPTLLSAGVNRFELVVWPSFAVRTGVSPPVLGDLDTLHKRYNELGLLERTAIRGGLIWVFSVTGGGVLLVGWCSRNRSFQCMGLGIVLHSLYRWSSLADTTPIDFQLFEGLVSSFRLMAGPWFCLGILHHFNKATAGYQRALMCMSLLLPAALWTLGVSISTVMAVFVPSIILILLVTSAAVLWSWQSRVMTDAALALCLVLIVVGVLNDWLELVGWKTQGVDHRWYLCIVPALMVSGLSMRIMMKQGEMIAEALWQRESELTIAYGYLLSYERAFSSQMERERIMRDLHDGMGSSLASAKLAVQSGSLSPSDIAQVLEECMDDMRLVLDTASVAMLPLSEAITDYRYRMEPRLRVAGIGSSWVMDIPLDFSLDVSTTLSLMRVIQEAITNSVRHAQARHVCVTLLGGTPDSALSIVIQDDGIGSTAAAGVPKSGGRGTRNALRRAQQIGAHYECKADRQGTTVRLILPKKGLLPCSCREVAVA